MFHTFHNHHLPFNYYSTEQTLCPRGLGNSPSPGQALCLLALFEIPSFIYHISHNNKSKDYGMPTIWRHHARPFNYVILFHLDHSPVMEYCYLTITQNYLLHVLLYLLTLFTECFPHFSAKHFTFLSSCLWVDALVPLLQMKKWRIPRGKKCNQSHSQ